MKKYRTWQEILIERLAADKERAVGYLDVALEEYQEDGDTLFFLSGVENVIQAQGGIEDLAKRVGIDPQILLEMLASKESPRLDMFNKILRGLGCQLSIEPLENVDHTDDAVIPLPINENPTLERTTESGELR